jgi:hypothetical protein
MRRTLVPVILGLVLIVAGVLYLLQSLGVIGQGADYFWGTAFAAGGFAFLYVYFTGQSKHWWPLIPGLTLLALGALIVLGLAAPEVAEIWGGTIFLGGIGLAFWIIYFLDRSQWWPIIPAGALFTLAATAGVGSAFEGIDAVWVFFLGLGLTFVLVAYLPPAQARTKWAMIPAIVLIVIAAIVGLASVSSLEYLWPVALIVVGLFLAGRAFLGRSRA